MLLAVCKQGVQELRCRWGGTESTRLRALLHHSGGLAASAPLMQHLGTGEVLCLVFNLTITFNDGEAGLLALRGLNPNTLSTSTCRVVSTGQQGGTHLPPGAASIPLNVFCLPWTSPGQGEDKR